MFDSRREIPVNLLRFLGIVSILAVIGALTWLGERSYLTFHSLAELFSITVAAAVFVIAWNVRDSIDNGYLLFFGIALLFVAAIDLAHMLAYDGMGVFPGYGPNLPTQLWIAARILEAASLLAAPTFLSRRLRPLLAFSLFTVLTMLVILSTFKWRIFPACYIEGRGLTPFKVIAEYVICGILILALIRLLKNRSRFQRSTLLLLSSSILATILSELAFTQYAGVYGDFNLIGHLLKIVAVVFIYKAIVETGFRRPYELLYRSLAESERKFRSVVESNMIGVVFADAITGEVTEANDEYLRIIGRSRSDLEERRINWKAMTTPETLTLGEDAAHAGDAVDKNVRSFERECIHSDGSRVPVIVGGAYLDSTQLRIVSYILDNTARKRAENAMLRLNIELEQRVKERTAKLAKAGEKVQAERQRFLDVLETLPVIIMLLRPDYRVEWVNRAYREALGDNVGRLCYAGQFGRDKPCDECQALIPLKTGKPQHWEWALPNNRIFEIYNFPFADLNGSPMILEMDMDITNRRKAEQELRQAHENLEARAAQLRALAGELTLTEQKERSRLAKVLHDHLQQLLVAAKFRMTILGRLGDDVIKEASKEVEELIDESIAASRSLTAELSPPILHDAGLSAGLEWLSRQMADRQGLLVELELEETGALPEDLKILLFESARELLFNVVKHAHTRSSWISLRRVDGFLQLTVSDRGDGFDPNHMPKAGESGRGFGLFSIRERLELFGGKVEIQSAPGQGSRIFVSVPIKPQPLAPSHAAAGAAELPKLSKAERAPSRPAGRKIRVLLADDHAVVRQGVANMIGGEPDIEVVGAAVDGLEAVVLAAKLLPDVILMDLSMPKLSGEKATRIIHKDHPEICIVALSMFEEAEKAQAIIEAGAVCYLTKGGPAEALIAAIRKHGVRHVPFIN